MTIVIPTRLAFVALLLSGPLGSLAGTGADDIRSLLASTATYELTFESSWSAATHPTDFPPNPHFSGLIGGTHNESARFWDAGTVASDGIESMAETGAKTLLQGEVQAAISAGNAEFILSGGGISISPGSVSLTFDVSGSFPLVTVVSMLAPSPDWFVGTSGLNLMEGGDWRQQVVVPLIVHDAGTDSGTTYRSPNQDTDPAAVVSELTNSPFDGDNVVGTFTFTLQSVVARDPTPDLPTEAVSSVYPNPTTGLFSVDVWSDRRQFVRASLYDATGRLVRKKDIGWIDDAGIREVRVDGSDLAGQLYFVRITGRTIDEVRAVTIRR
ncbi:MAG: spondin domain-containing protein [Rhodothermia bacterium]|nr:spondin domain-containing protein [Rhodothermia bacterium]